MKFEDDYIQDDPGTRFDKLTRMVPELVEGLSAGEV